MQWNLIDAQKKIFHLIIDHGIIEVIFNRGLVVLAVKTLHPDRLLIISGEANLWL